MNKNLFLRLCLMMCVLFTLWQCSSEDFSLAENNPKRNDSEFFKHSSSRGLANRGGVDYISILEAYNEEHNFLVTMPDQRGMPIWEKMRVLNSEVATGLIIPLSYDNETLSSVLFATLDDSNAVTGVKDYDNNLLEEIIYNQNLNKDFRQGILTSYLVTDHYTFNTTEFTNIPTDLFSGIKHGKDSIKLSFNGYVKEENSKSLGARLMISTTCLNIYHCKNNKPPSLCDGCSLCLTKTCETEYIFTDDDFPTMPPGNPGGGGGGTGTGTGPTPTNPGQQPPRDPCAFATVFYRLMPGCGSTGTGDGGDLIDDPCEKVKAIVNNAKLKPKIEELKIYSLTAEEFEKGYQQDKSGNVTPAAVNGAHHVDFIVDQNSLGGIHCHTLNGNHMFSPRDILALISFADVQNHTLPAGSTEDNTGDAFLGMISQSGTYFITFNGASGDLPPQMTDAEKDAYEIKLNAEYKKIILKLLKSEGKQKGDDLSDTGLQKLFFGILKEMDLESKIHLIKEDDGNTSTIQQNPDGTIKAPTPC